MTAVSKPPRQEIARVYLAPHKPLGDWTVDDLIKFADDCRRSGIPGDTSLLRDRERYEFGAEASLFYAERITTLESSQYRPGE